MPVTCAIKAKLQLQPCY